MARRSPARFLAPIALVAVAIAFYAVLTGHHASSGGSETGIPARLATPTATAKGKKARRARKVYVVRAGDTPSGIAEKTGVPLSRLQKLNPGLDPQSLTPGQRLRLR